MSRSADFYDAHLRARDHAFPPNPLAKLEKGQWERMAEGGTPGFRWRLLEGTAHEEAQAGGHQGWPVERQDLRMWESHHEHMGPQWDDYGDEGDGE